MRKYLRGKFLEIRTPRTLIVWMIGSILCPIMLVMAVDQHETAENLNKEIEANERIDAILSRKAHDPEYAARIDCCNQQAFNKHQLEWTVKKVPVEPHEMEEKRALVKPIFMLDEMDASRANIKRKWKDSKYILFRDNNGNLFSFDLTTPLFEENDG